MSRGLGSGFTRAFVDAIAGEHVTAFPATIDGTLRLHVGEPGPDLADNIVAGSERRATLVVHDDLQGYVYVHGPREWPIPEDIEDFRPASFSWVPHNATEARFPIQLHGIKEVTGRDILHLDKRIPWSVTSA